MDDFASPEQVEQQLAGIRKETLEAPMLSEPEALDTSSHLVDEFKDNPVFNAQIGELLSKGSYTSVLYARRDGNCFYRCVAFQLFSLLLKDPEFASATKAKLDSLRESFIQLFGEYSEDFYDVVVDIVNRIISHSITSDAELLQVMNSSDDGPYIIVFFRYAVSCTIRANADDFSPFIMGSEYPTLEAYCAGAVEPVDHVSDHVEIVAFAQLFNVEVVVESLSQSSKSLSRLVFNEISPPTDRVVYLLFRPGHYDLLQAKQLEHHSNGFLEPNSISIYQ